MMHIVDAGPLLTFLSRGHENLLLTAIAQTPSGGRFYVPEAVIEEVRRKATQRRGEQQRRDFIRASGKLSQLIPKRVTVLNDDTTPSMIHAAAQLGVAPPHQLRTRDKDLGETMAVLHGYVQAASGKPVIVVIDDAGGIALARRAQTQMKQTSQVTQKGSIRIWTAETVLFLAAKAGTIRDRTQLHQVLDDLAPLEGNVQNNKSSLEERISRHLLALGIWFLLIGR